MTLRLRVDVDSVLKLLAFLLSSALFAFSVWYVWTAFSVPVELEIREGTVWLHALAKRAGVDIYDSNQVAFVNMSHGPMESILKGWLATIAPALPGCMVTRCFVVLLPFFLLGSAYVIGRKNLTVALLAAAALHLFLANFTIMLVVGRSDATVLCGLALCGALAHGLLVDRHREWFNWRYVALQIVLGSSSAVVFLTSWRIVPTIATIHLVVLSKQLAESSRRFRSLLHSTVLAVAGFALVWVPTFLWELHGDRHAYYKRFFGFYSRASGWGAFAGPEFRLFPGEIMQFGQGPLLLLAALLVAALFRLRRERAQFIAWSLLLPIGWGAYAYGYFRNQGGGGVYYFCPFFFSAWLLILHALRRQSVSRPWVQLASAGLIAYLLPWRGLLDQRQQLADIRSQAQTFLKDVAKRTGGRPVFGEDTHLFKREYRDEIVDTGDTVNAIASSGYYGTDFTRKYQSYAMTLVAAPPQFIIEDMLDLQNRHGTTTPQLADLLRNRYAVAIQGPANLVANVAVRSRGNSPAGTIALFERIAE